MAHYWFVLLCTHLLTHLDLLDFQAAALAMQEQERLANEEAEKRLKAALTAKREPGTSATSPVTGAASTVRDVASDAKLTVQDVMTDVQMETESTTSPPMEVRSSHFLL
jgi:THO complex subunit 2